MATDLMGHTQRQPDLVGGAGSLSIGPATGECGGGSGPESKSGGPEGVHGDGSRVGSVGGGVGEGFSEVERLAVRREGCQDTTF